MVDSTQHLEETSRAILEAGISLSALDAGAEAYRRCEAAEKTNAGSSTLRKEREPHINIALNVFDPKNLVNRKAERIAEL